MGTLQDQLKKVIDKWDGEDQPTTSQEKQMETKNTHTTQTDRIFEFVRANPGLKSMQINEMILKAHPDIPADNVTSLLKQLADAHRLNRVDTGELSFRGHPIFEYYANTEAERQAGLLEDRRRQSIRKAQVARAAAARAAKQKKAEEVKAKAQQVAVPTNAPTAWNAKDALNGLTVLQARELYVELKAIFGA